MNGFFSNDLFVFAFEESHIPVMSQDNVQLESGACRIEPGMPWFFELDKI
jgi:hypothetical protein